MRHLPELNRYRTVQIAAAQLIEPGDDDALPKRIVLLPGDPLEAANDGRRHVVTDAAVVVAETLRRAPSDGRRPVTFDHAGLYGFWSAPAAAWLSDFQVESDGAISAAVAWTRRGASALSDLEYRYISAEYDIRPKRGDDSTWEVQWIRGASLVNQPGFDLPALAAASAGLGGNEMDIRKLLGLTPEASDEEVAAAAAEWQRDREVASAAREALSLETGADGAAVRTAVASAQGSAGTGSDPDPAQYVPRAQYDELVVRVAGLESQRSSEGAERAVASAVEAGAIAPAQREWALQYATSDLVGFQAYAKAAPKIFGPDTPAAVAAAAAAAGDPANGVRSGAEREVIAQLGISEDAYTASAAEIDGRAGRS